MCIYVGLIVFLTHFICITIFTHLTICIYIFYYNTKCVSLTDAGKHVATCTSTRGRCYLNRGTGLLPLSKTRKKESRTSALRRQCLPKDPWSS